MGILGAEGTKYLFSAAAWSNAGSKEQGVLESTKRGLQISQFWGPFPLQRNSQFSGSSSECEILVKRRQCSGLQHSSPWFSQTLRHGFCTRVFCQAQRDSEERNSHLQHFSAVSTTSRSKMAIESSCDLGERVEQGMQAENQGSNSHDVVDHHALNANFRVGRRMLLGAIAIGLYSAYQTSETARAAGNGFKFSLPRAWLLGDSEPDMAQGEVGKGQGEKKDSEPGEESRVYDATALDEPVAIGSNDKDRVWKKLLETRVVYLGEAEKVADSDDKLLELEIVRTLRKKCFEQKRSISLALEAFPCPLQPQLNAYMNKTLTEDGLRIMASHLREELWRELLPILQYCKSNGVRLVACGAPLKVLRTVQASGVQALNRSDTRMYIPPAGGGYKFKSSPLDASKSVDILPNASGRFGPGPYRFAQARIVEDYTMSKVIAQIVKDGGALGLLLVIAGASHVKYGTRGTGVPAWIAKNKEMQKRTQAIVLLNPERQLLRKEGDVPEADFLWYSAAKVCKRNCFDRAQVARVMGAAGRRRDALPKDLQVGLKQGLVAPEILESFFELEQNPIMAELTGRFQGVRERFLADPRFLQRLAIEESISLTTAIIAQYKKRRHRFWKELDYVATDTIRGAVVDFFTVWLPAPRLSFRELDANESFNALDSLKGFLGSFPDNAFQRPHAGENWGLGERVGAILVGGLKLFGVGFISAIGTSVGSNFILNARQFLSSQATYDQTPKDTRTPPLKTALVYSTFLGTSANLRYQVIAGVVEHWAADYWLATQPLAGSALSFVSRVANSYYGTGQWIDLAKFTGVQLDDDAISSSPTLDGEADVVKTSELVSTTSTSVEDVASKTGSADPVQDRLKVPNTKFLGSPED